MLACCMLFLVLAVISGYRSFLVRSLDAAKLDQFYCILT